MAREIARQALLMALGAVAGGLVGSCRSAADSPAPAPPRNHLPSLGARCNRLDDAIDETVVLPSNDQYVSAKAVFNARFAASKPKAVVIVKSTDDVRKAVAFAADHAESRSRRVVVDTRTSVLQRRVVPWSSACASCRGLTVHDEPAPATMSPAVKLVTSDRIGRRGHGSDRIILGGRRRCRPGRHRVRVAAPGSWRAVGWTTAHQAVQEDSTGRYVNYIESDTPAQEYFGGISCGSPPPAGGRRDGVLYSGLKF